MNKYHQTFVDEDGTYVKIENKEDHVQYLIRRLKDLITRNRIIFNQSFQLTTRIIEYKQPWYKSIFGNNKELRGIIGQQKMLDQTERELYRKIQSKIAELEKVINDEV